MQIWECNCGGKHREGMAGSHFQKDTGYVWLWNLRFSGYCLCCRIFIFPFKGFLFSFHFSARKIIGLTTAKDEVSFIQLNDLSGCIF